MLTAIQSTCTGVTCPPPRIHLASKVNTPRTLALLSNLQPNPSLFLSLGRSSPNFISALNSSQRDTFKTLVLMVTPCLKVVQWLHLTQKRSTAHVHDGPLPPATWLHSLSGSPQGLSSLLLQARTLQSSQLCIPTHWPGSGLKSSQCSRASKNQRLSSEAGDTRDQMILCSPYGLTWPSPTYRTAILWVS